MRPIKLIKLEDEDDILRENVFSDDEINILKRLRIGRLYETKA